MGPICALFALLLSSLSVMGNSPGGRLVVWDTGVPLSATKPASQTSDWLAVPSDLLQLEKDPAKASSDPGYYGRDYSFQGDAVVENRHLTALFRSAAGRVTVLRKAAATTTGSQPSDARLGDEILELAPLNGSAAPSRIKQCNLVRHAGDEVVLDVVFTAGKLEETTVQFCFGRSEIVQIKPLSGAKGMQVFSPVEFAVAPYYVGDDLIFGSDAYAKQSVLHLPVEQTLLSLVRGENLQWVMTWPKGKQQVRLVSQGAVGEKRRTDLIEFESDGQSFFLAPLTAPGIWHLEKLSATQLEKDFKATWKRPFPARWKTQLWEENVRTTFAFKESKAQIWRGVPGSYSYPVWFDGDAAFYRLSKKVPPKGESLIYFLEGSSTPDDVTTPVDVVRSTLGRTEAEALLDTNGRKLRTHHRRGGSGVRRACTCGCTEFIQAIFESGEEVQRKAEIKDALDDMNFFVEQHVARIDEYKKFAEQMRAFLRQAASASPELKPFLDEVVQIPDQILQEYEVQKENMKSHAHAQDLTRQTLALAEKKAPNNVKDYMELLKAWRAMGGAQDYIVAQCHTLTRKLAQTAGYLGVSDAKTAGFAREIGERCRRCLRNPDGYEIWANY